MFELIRTMSIKPTLTSSISTSEQRAWPFYVMVLSIFFALVSPHLLSDGMFLDGLIYATVSRNLAEGLGGLWSPYYFGPPGTVFYEHPPLAFWLQGIFFRIVGDSIYVERIYSFLTFVLTGYIIVRIWKIVVKKHLQTTGWLPLFLLVITPTVFWAATNNMLENTLMIFTSGSVYFYVSSRHSRFYFLFLIISGLLLSLGFLVKGFVSFFPLSLPFWVWIIRREEGFLKMAADSIIMFFSASLILIVLLKTNTGAYEFLLTYLDHQVVNSIKNIKTVESHFTVLLFWLNDILPSLIVAGLILWSTIKKRIIGLLDLKENSKWAMIFFLVGLSGVLPIMITLKQRSFYILPTLVFFILCIALWISPAVMAIVSRLRSYQKIKWTALIMFFVCFGAVASQIGSIGRDKDELDDIRVITSVVPKGSTVSITPEMREIWGLQAQLARYAHISVDLAAKPYLVTMKGNKYIPIGYSKVELNTSIYELHKKF
jgi:4-amino-4-deoxy-L-arabinose transferase-like glycosyltransferase